MFMPSGTPWWGALLALAVCGAGPLAAVEYHVSPKGADDKPGTAAEPFRTLAKAAAVLKAGDTCVIHAGTYRETVQPANSGEAGKPIVFSAAPGENVVFSGTDEVKGWTIHKDKIQKAAIAGPLEQVFVDGRIMTPARFPNSPAKHWEPATLRFTPRTEPPEALNGRDHYKLDCPEITQPDGFWKDAIIWGLSERLGWVASTAVLKGSEKGAVWVSKDPKAVGRAGREMAPWFGDGPGRGYITGCLNGLDAEREWHWQDGTLYLFPPGGADASQLTVEVTRRKYAFDLTEKKFIELRGLRLFAASVNLDQAEDCALDGCHVRWPCVQRILRGSFNRDRAVSPASEGLGVVLGGRRNVIRNSVIAFSTGDGLTVFGSDNLVENCVVHDCNVYASDCAAVCVTGTGHILHNNTLFNAGRSILVHRFLVKGRIEHNHLYNAGLLSNDLGMTYSYHTKSEGTVMAYNIIHHNWGRAPGNVGLYLDDTCQQHIVHHNLIYAVSEAMALNPPASQNNLVVNNTLDGYNVSLGMGTHRENDLTGTRLVNNIFTHGLPPKMPNIQLDGNLFKETNARFVGWPGVDLAATAREEHVKGWWGPARLNATVADALACYQLAADSPAVDGGVEVPPYTDGFTGKAPDFGAFECGQPPWKAGSSIPADQWDSDPDFAIAPDHKGPCYEKPAAAPPAPTPPPAPAAPAQ